MIIGKETNVNENVEVNEAVASSKLIKLLKSADGSVDEFSRIVRGLSFKANDGLTVNIEKWDVKSAKNYISKYSKLLLDIAKEISAVKLNESVEDSDINEALKPVKVGWYGNSNPKLPDGTPELQGENKAILVAITKGDTKDKFAVVAVMGDDGEHLLQTELDDKKSAVKFAEKLLKEVNDDMYDAKKVAKKYNMQYFYQG